jgi:hypothetical protein
MRVTKNENGQFVVVDDPIRLTGEGADKFLAEMERRNATGNSAKQTQFLKRASKVYAATLAKLSGR